jgi:hypothetical protein
MLKGVKPMALFWREPGMEVDDVGDVDFDEHVAQGRITRFVDVDPETSIETYRYALPTEEWRAKLSQLIARMCREGTAQSIFSRDDLARLEGTLLGYTKNSIEAFVARGIALYPERAHNVKSRCNAL